LGDGLLIEPQNAFAILPETILDAPLRAVTERSKAMLLALVPPAIVLTPVLPLISAKAFLHVLEKLSLVLDTIRLNVNAIALHVVRMPLAIVLASIEPEVDTVAMALVVEPLTVVRAAIGPDILTPALFLGHGVVTIKLGAFSPSFDAMSMLQVLFPHAFIARTFDRSIYTIAVSFVVEPIPIIYIAICVEKLPIATRLIELPITFVAGRVRPHHRAFAMAQATFPLALVDGTGAICEGLLFSDSIVTINST